MPSTTMMNWHSVGVLAYAHFGGERSHMDQRKNGGQAYLCPMHRDVRQPNPGKCPRCGMDLLPEGTRFAMLRHMISRPLHLLIMVVVMLAVMAAAMMMMR
jgi:Heavy metal binding domain